VLVLPEVILPEQADQLIVAARRVEGAQAGARSVEMASHVLVGADRQTRNADQLVGPARGQIGSDAEISSVISELIKIWDLVICVGREQVFQPVLEDLLFDRCHGDDLESHMSR